MSDIVEEGIDEVCKELCDFLIEKNRSYGNSAASPIRIFAKNIDTLTQIDVRIDDKLNRLANGSEYKDEDTLKDLTGYLVLRMVIEKIIGKLDE